MTTPSILLIDDHPMFRAGLSMVIHRQLPHTAIYQSSSVHDALSGAPAHLQLILLDIKLNGSSGLEGISALLRRWPTTPILMLSSHDEPETTRLALARGATAFVSKAESPENIMATIARLLRGDLPEPDAVASDSGKHLTPRQQEVLALLHLGLSNKLIARELALSDNTVRRHMQEILKFFQVATRAEAVFTARQRALVG